MSETPYIVEDKDLATNERVRRQGEKVIENVKEAQRAFWNVD